jgi:hypothetical protein
VAVFPDRIVLKNSADSSASIISEIGSGGDDPITQGEIVLGVEPGNVQIYTLDSNGNVITIATGSAAARAIVSDAEPTVGIGGIPLSEGDLWYKGSTGVFHVYENNAWAEISGSGAGALALGGLSDVTISTTPTNGQVLTYQASSGVWIAGNNTSIPLEETGDLITSIGDQPYRLEIGDPNQVLTVGALGEVEWADPAAVSVSELSDLTDVDDSLTPSVGQVLVYNDVTSQWEAGSVAGTGTVTSVGITPGSGISVTGGPVTSAGSIEVSVGPSGVSSGVYGAAKVNVGSDGRIVSASVSGANDLSDVNTTAVTPSDGDTLIWNSGLSEWRPGNITGAVTSIVAGTSVSISPTGGTGDVTINASLGGSIDQLDDVDTTTSAPVNGEVLAWDNANSVWVPAPPTIGAEILDDLTDVDADTPSDGEGLFYNATSGKWETGATGAGTVTNVAVTASGGLSSTGGPITTSGTINIELEDTGVSSGTYNNPSIAVNSKGQITNAVSGASISSIDDLVDVDTTTVSPTNGQALVWSTSSSRWVPGLVTGGGGGGSGAGLYMQEAQTSSASGQATFIDIGFSGVVQKVAANVDTWLVLYSSGDARTADSTRLFDEDPAPGSGVVLEVYIPAGETVEISPGTTYLNNDIVTSEAIYAAMRTSAGVNIVSTVSIFTFGMAAITAVNGGTFGSGL